MDSVLCVDISSEPARVLVVGIQERKLTLLEQRTVALSSAVAAKELSRTDLLSSVGLNGSHSPNTEDVTETEDGDIQTASAAPFGPLQQAIAELTHEWNNSVLVIPMNDYFSLNLNLPFSDAKSLNRILDLEVQDVIPFEVDDFLVQGQALSALADGRYDVHVSLAPKTLIRNIVALCRSIRFEPTIISTPCSSLGALAALAPDYFVDNCAFVSVQNRAMYLSALIDGRIRFDRVLRLEDIGVGPRPLESVVSDLRMTIMAIEKRYSRTLATIYIDAPTILINELRQSLGRPIEQLTVAEFIDQSSPDNALSAAPAIFAAEATASIPLTNFRVREFSFRPDFGALLLGLRRLSPLIVLAGVALTVTFALTYLLRQHQLSRLQTAMIEKSIAAVPELATKDGDPVQGFRAELDGMSKELENLGSPHSLTALDAFVEISKDLTGQAGITVNQIDIRPNRLVIDLTAPDYTSGDRIERLFKKRRDVYCNTKKETGSASGTTGARNFKFELKVCE